MSLAVRLSHRALMESCNKAVTISTALLRRHGLPPRGAPLAEPADRLPKHLSRRRPRLRTPLRRSEGRGCGRSRLAGERSGGSRPLRPPRRRLARDRRRPGHRGRAARGRPRPPERAHPGLRVPPGHSVSTRPVLSAKIPRQTRGRPGAGAGEADDMSGRRGTSEEVVGAGGFEPPTCCSQSNCATPALRPGAPDSRPAAQGCPIATGDAG